MTPDRFEDVYGTDEDARRRALAQLSTAPDVDPGLLKLRAARSSLDAANAASPVPVSDGLPMPTFRPISAPAGATAAPKSTADAPASKRLPRDTEFDAAMAAERENELGAGLARAGAMASAALTHRKFDASDWDALEKSGMSPVQQLMASRAASAEKAKAAHAASMADPNSPESIRMRATIKAALPNVPDDVLAGISAADSGDIFTKLMGGAKLAAESEAHRLSRQESAERFKNAQEEHKADNARQERQFLMQLAETRAGRADNHAVQIMLAQMAAKERAAKEAEDKAKGTVIPGLEVAPGAQPTQDDAKKVKESVAARSRMNSQVDELMNLYKQHGTEMVGPVAVRMKQLMTGIKLEGKNLAGLGALSGPDEALMDAISGADPTSLSSNVKDVFGLDTTKQALEGVKTWANSQAEGNMNAYGYRPKAGVQPKPDIDLSAPQTVVKNGKKYVYENGQWFAEE